MESNDINCYKDKIENKIFRVVLIVHIVLMALWISQGIISIGVLLITVITCVLLKLNKRIIKSKIALVIVLIIYFSLMFFIPAHVFYHHEHIIDNNNYVEQTINGKKIKFPKETIREYKEYTNCYFINIYTNKNLLY